MPVAPPPPRMPALTNLAAFAQVGEAGGYAQAARRLGVTPGALRQQVRALEENLGCQLVQSHARGLDVTDIGAQLCEGLIPAFADLNEVMSALGGGSVLRPLRAFEAAVRRQSFSAAAEELGVTSRAISAQIKTLEAALGHRVFERSAQGVRPLPSALKQLPMLSLALQEIDQACQLAAKRPVRIAALPAIAQLWLAPRLRDLRAALPDVNFSITALESLPPQKHSPYDLGLFFAPSGGRKLCEDSLVPVAHPDLLPDVQAGVPLIKLTDSTWIGDWRLWSVASGHHLNFATSVTHSLYSLALGEALGGAGVLMGHSCLLAGHISDGKLIELGPGVQTEAALRVFPLSRSAFTDRVVQELEKLATSDSV